MLDFDRDNNSKHSGQRQWAWQRVHAKRFREAVLYGESIVQFAAQYLLVRRSSLLLMSLSSIAEWLVYAMNPMPPAL